jgi:eukaryotic-like serine/threonine-protein kinase
MTGRKLGSYEVLEKLGEGGMGEVWRARDERLNRSVAIKILPAEVAGDPARRQRFEQEARSLAALNHPNIVSVYDIGQNNGQSYIVSELVDGEPLRAVIERGPPGLRRLLDIATQMAEGIAAAHALGIVHRDLKPENIMVSRDGRVKVLDFGLAKHSAPAAGEEGATIAMSHPGMVLGTVGYMSPEQVRGEAVDARSDIFSFGCVLYELAAGRRAFDGKSAADVMSAILREEPAELDGGQAALPPVVDAIVRRCLEKQPARRFQSAADLAFALRSVSHTSTAQAAALPGPVSRRAWWKPLLAVIGAALLFAGGYWVRGRLAAAAPPEFHRLTFREGRIAAARLMPDGRNVVYAAAWDGGAPHLYLGTTGSPDARDLNAPPDSRLLAVSSQSDLALLTGPFNPDGSGTLSRTSLAGGQSRGLLDNVLFADWSPDGSEMAVVRRIGGVGRIEYPIGKVLYQNQWLLPEIRVSPDGQRVAFARYDNGSAIAIFTVDRSGKVQKLGVVSGQTSQPGSPDLCWTGDGREIWFRSFDENARNTILAIDASGKVRVVARFPARISLYDLGAGGRALLSTDSGRMGIRALAPGENAERDLSSLESSLLRDMTPDGRIILIDVLGESGGPKGSIYWRLTDGSPPVRLGDGYAFAISPDGKWVTGYSSREDLKRMYELMPTGPGETVPLSFPQLPYQMGVVAGWLPGDGNYLVGGPSKTKKWQLFVWNRAANSLRPVTPDDMEDGLPLVSPDGQRFAAASPSQGWLVCTIASGACRPIPGLTHHDLPVGWRQDGKSIYVVMHHDENRMFMVSLIDVATGARTPWKEIRPGTMVDEVSNLKITPDGRAYAYNYSTSRSDLYLAEGLR